MNIELKIILAAISLAILFPIFMQLEDWYSRRKQAKAALTGTQEVNDE